MTPSALQLINSSTPTLLAFGFVSPWLLWGLALGGVPLLIQWLHRREYTERVWAAMRFLRAATKSESRRLRFESLLLLLIRTSILVLAAVAVSEPFWESAGWLAPSASRVHRLIVIDTSLSMQYESNGLAVSDRARAAVRRLITDGETGDSYQLVTIGREGRAVVRQPAFDAAEILAEIDRLEWTEEFGDVPSALSLGQRLLEESPTGGVVTVHLISDFQRSNWWPASEAVRQRIRKAVGELAEAGTLSLVRVGDDDAVNGAVMDVNVETTLVTSASPVEVTAEVRQVGDRSAMRFEVAENERVLHAQTVESTTAGGMTVSFRTQWNEPGSHGLDVRIGEDGLTEDDHRWVTVTVRDALNVLLVNGRESTESLGRATDYVELALSPLGGLRSFSGNVERPLSSTEGVGRRSQPGSIEFRSSVVGEAELARTELAAFDCVILCDVPFLSETEVKRLKTFVRGGGGLVIGLGEQVEPGAYNRFFWSDDDGLLPARLLGVRGEHDSEREHDGEPFHFAEPASGHPIVQPFVGNPRAGLTTANVYRYYEVELNGAEVNGIGVTGGPETGNRRRDRNVMTNAESSVAGQARVAVAYSNGDPAIVECQYGDGRVLLVTTSLDDRWGSWALWPSFLPMLHRIVEHAVTGESENALMVGSTLRRQYPFQSVGLTATVQQPDGRRSSAQTRLIEGATEVLFDETRKSGLYRLILGPPLNTTELVAVNVDARESDLRSLDEVELEGTVLRGVEAAFGPGTERLSRTEGLRPPSTPFTHWLLMAVLILLCVEQVMAWNARFGMMALGAAPLVLLGFAVVPTATTVGLLIAAVAFWAMRASGRRSAPARG